MIAPDVDAFYRVSVILLLISTAVSSAEILAIPRAFIALMRQSPAVRRPPRHWNVLHAFSVLCAVACLCLLFASGTGLAFQLAFVLLTTSAVASYRLRATGRDGADQVRIIGLSIVSLSFLIPGEQGKAVAIGFLGCQVLIAYTTSGIAKLRSPLWRDGHVLGPILSTYSFGSPSVASLLFRYPGMERLASHAAIAVMLAVPVCFFLPGQAPLLVALASIFAFHCSTALLMGLNDFMLTFPAAYPGVIYLHHLLMG